MMAAQLPPGGGDVPDSREQVGGEERMKVELVLGTHAILSERESG